MIQYAHQQVFSTGDWWDVVEAPHIGEPWLYGRTYVADEGYMTLQQTEPYDASEQTALLKAFGDLLAAVTLDGGRKRASGTKPPWWRDLSHEAAIFSHLNAWKHGVTKDHDSGAHPLVHLAWRALAIAWQETHGLVDPEKR